MALCAAALTAVIFVPLWRIELAAPQYPEGLFLLIYPNKLGGNVDIVNGLNHYIGMQTLHAENFIEFSVLRYFIGFFAGSSIVAALLGTKKILVLLFGLFVTFGVVAMADFWRWEYNYGHNLDPHAAIVVPGMSYQPPLIGYKQLLNFGAYSVPDIGGWIFVLAGMLILVALMYESEWAKRLIKRKPVPALVSIFFLQGLLISCKNEVEPIRLNKDNCDHCHMTISDGRFGGELITEKGRVYKFDDLKCLLNFYHENKENGARQTYVHNYLANNILIRAESSFFVSSESLKSPMGGNTGAFSTFKEADLYAEKWDSKVSDWKTINP